MRAASVGASAKRSAGADSAVTGGARTRSKKGSTGETSFRARRAGLPGVAVSYDLTEREHEQIEQAKKYQARAAGVLGEFVENMPRLMPPGTSLHFMGTFRMGPADDGTSVCDSFSRVWGVPGLVLAGNGLIPTANACNPTLTSVALAIRGARSLGAQLQRGATAAA